MGIGIMSAVGVGIIGLIWGLIRWKRRQLEALEANERGDETVAEW